MAVVPKQNSLDLLKNLVPLNTLPEESLAELMEAVAFEKLGRGDILFPAGDTDPERIYLLSGRVSLLEGGREVDTVDAGSNMARYPIAHRIPRDLTAKAKSKIEVVRIDSKVLSEMLSKAGNSVYEVGELEAGADDDWMSQLLQSPIFQRIPAANIQNIMMRMEEVEVTAGEQIIRQGEEGDYFYLINRGSCQIIRERDQGQAEELAQIGPGTCFGEESLLSDQPRTSSVSMLTDGVLVRLGKQDFVEYIKHPLANAIEYEDALAEVSRGAVWMDVRSAAEYERGHLPGSLSVPFNSIRTRLNSLDKGVPYIVYCQDGLVSSTAVYLLMAQGIEASVLVRGLESVPEQLVQVAIAQGGAQIINFRQDQAEPAIAEKPLASGVDDEAGLLRERLRKTESQARDQLLRTRKMKLLFEEVKSRLELVEKERAEALNQQADLQQERDHLQLQLTQLNGEVEQLQTALDKSIGQAEALEQGWRQQDQSVADYKARIAELEASLQQAIDESAGEQAGLEAELAGVRAQSEQIERRLLQEQGQCSELQQQVSAFAGKEEALQQALAQALAEQTATQEQLAQLQSASGQREQALQDAQSMLQDQLDQALAAVSETESRLADAQRAHDQLQAERDAEQDRHAGTVQQLEQQVASLEGQNKALEQQAGQAQSELQEKLQLAERSLQTVQQELLDADGARQGIKAELESVQASLLHAQEQAEQRGSSDDQALQQAQQRQVELEARLQQQIDSTSALEQQLKQQQEAPGEIASAQQRIAELEQLAQQRTEELTALQLTLDKTSQRLEAADSELPPLRELHEQAKLHEVELQSALDLTQQQLEASRSQLELAHAESEQLAKANAALTVADERIGQLEAELGEALHQFQTLGQKVAQESASDAMQSQLEMLRSELEAMDARRLAAEEALSQAEGETGSAAGDGPLQAELETLTHALDEADQAYDAISQQLREVEAERDGARAEVDVLQSLQLVADENSATATQQEEAVALLQEKLKTLQQELAAARLAAEDSAADTRLQEELAALRQQLQERELNGSADAAENELLRQDLDSLRKSFEERSGELKASRDTIMLLEEKTEERNGEIDQLQRALEALQLDIAQAGADRAAAIESRDQLQQTLSELKQEMERQSSEDDLLDSRLAGVSASSVMEGGGSVSPAKLRLSGIAAGALLAFALAEGLSMLGGNGELVSGLFSSDRSAEMIVSDAPVASTASNDSPQVVAKADLAARVTPVLPGPKVDNSLAVATVEPILTAAKTPPPPAIKEPATGSQVQDRLRSGGRAPALVYLRGGSFTMGSDTNHLAPQERPEHQVRLASFAIGKYEVTFDEYERFARATNRTLPDDLGWGRGKRPVVNVSWDDAVAYSRWLSSETGQRYRLPTEAEWEYAASGGADSYYWWGFQLGQNQANCFNCGSAWDRISTAPVGSFQANGFGLHNTAGNVIEWVGDCYHDSYLGAPSDGQAWDEPGCKKRTVRGGAFNKPGDSLRITKRGAQEADSRLFTTGFRVARDVTAVK